MTFIVHQVIYYHETSEHLNTELDDCMIPEGPVHRLLLPPDQSPPPVLRSPGHHVVSSHHRDPVQAQEQHQPVGREAHDAEILEEVSLPRFQGQPAVGGEVSQAEGHAHRGLDHHSQQEQDLLVIGPLHCCMREMLSALKCVEICQRITS